ncbi:heart- and neural crest derivatives-expressed protein 2-like [Sitophilus oryzae]|uniref:Heart- and neural crest derivatives-expressed protein 2-like n=1 Tax=Sitophilus oryzae TaxID=7048 RepID=A0A6J2XZJ3_SITOR|nr:heart- and neural crest derivatives-expressed protein 2-like [Sitophilus oryzae]
MSYSNSPQDTDPFQYGYHHNHHNFHYISDGSTVGGDESNFWSNSPRSESPSPNVLQSPIDNSYQLYGNTPPCSNTNPHYGPYRSNYTTISSQSSLGTPFVRVIKRRTTANKKERRRTQSINNGYANLRDCIPNVPADTKLSKIKTLRLATSYIAYLTRALETDTPGTFKAELGTLSRKSNSANTQQNHHNNNSCMNGHNSPKSDSSEEGTTKKGRTGWPQHVWALELKQEQAL